MTRLTWDSPGSRYYETGIDRGVLYVGAADGVPWNGLASMVETPAGGELQSYYVDGVNYAQEALGEEFEATLSAFSTPASFAQCEGVVSLTTGLYATKQRRVPFGLTYRTRIGNDIQGSEYNYKIHVLYNAVAEPTNRTNQSLSDNPDITKLSWLLTARSNVIATAAPSAKLVVDASSIKPAAVAQIEDILYGTSTTAPRLPTPTELIAIVKANGMIVIVYGDGTFSVTGDAAIVQFPTADTIFLDNPGVVMVDADSFSATSP